MSLSAAAVEARLVQAGFFAGRALTQDLADACALGRPLFIVGPHGSGKTALGLALAPVLDARLVRLDCSPSLPPSAAAYRWDTARQLELIQEARIAGLDAAAIEREISTEQFLVKGPLLEAIEESAPGDPPVLLLVDALDAASPGLVALLERFVADYALDVAPLGTYEAGRLPFTVFTCQDGVTGLERIRAHCRELRLDYAAYEDEWAAIAAAVPSAAPALVSGVCNLARRLRSLELAIPPGTGEAIVFARRLVMAGRGRLDGRGIAMALPALVTLPEDRARFSGSGIDAILRPSIDRAG